MGLFINLMLSASDYTPRKKRFKYKQMILLLILEKNASDQIDLEASIGRNLKFQGSFN